MWLLNSLSLEPPKEFGIFGKVKLFCSPVPSPDAVSCPHYRDNVWPIVPGLVHSSHNFDSTRAPFDDFNDLLRR